MGKFSCLAALYAALSCINIDAAAAASPLDSVHPEWWPAGVSGQLRDPAVESQVDRILARMTLEERIGQMIQADIASITPQDLRAYPLGSILAGGNAAPDGDLHSPPRAWFELTQAFHRAALVPRADGNPPIPLLFGIDAVHGNAKLVGATIFPHNIGLGAAHDPDLIRRIGAATAQEVAAIGIDWTFAPTVAVARDPRWGRSYESYSESPDLVAEYAAAMVMGLQGERARSNFMAPGHTLSSVKHFLGDGGTLAGRDQGDAQVTESQLIALHAAGYTAAIKAGALIVMVSYNSWNGQKMHANRGLLTDVLKDRMGFDGFVVGDWNAHEQLPGCTKSNCPAAIRAGVDMLMAPDSWKELFRNTLAEARSGEISRERIDDAVRRIVRVKVIAGLFDRGNARLETPSFDPIGAAAHRMLAREAVRKSMVLLKNAHGMLPLNPAARVLVAGLAADDIAMQSGGWTIDWQGDHNQNADFPGATSIYAGIRAATSAAGGEATLSRDGSFITRPDAAIVVFGETPYAEFEGDRETLEFSPGDRSELALLRRLRALGIPTISVFLSGRPLWVNPELNASDAFVAAWLPGSEGAGIADVLFKQGGSVRYDFTGRLSFSWPETSMPAVFPAAGGVNGALFARGFGLDYQHPGTAPQAPLSEDPQVPEQWRSAPGSLFAAGHVTAPWSIFAADDGAEVHMTTRRQESPGGKLVLTVGTEGLSAVWHGSSPAMLRVSGRDNDFTGSARAGAAVEMRYRIDRAAEQKVAIGIRCSDPGCGDAGAAMLDATAFFTAASPGPWRTLIVPFSCFADRGADLRHVEVPLAIETAGNFAITIAAARVVYSEPRRKPACP